MKQSQKDLANTIIKEEIKAEAIRQRTKARGTDTGPGKAAGSAQKSKAKANTLSSGNQSLNISQTQP